MLLGAAVLGALIYTRQWREADLAAIADVQRRTGLEPVERSRRVLYWYWGSALLLWFGYLSTLIFAGRLIASALG